MQLREAVRKIHKEVVDRAKVDCDEAHRHSALGGCIAGDPDVVTICKLCESINILLAKIDKLQEGLGNIHFRGMGD